MPHVLEQPFAPALASEAALAIAAEAAARVEEIGRVDPDRPGLNAARDIQRLVDVLGPDARRQPVPRVVRQSHRLRGRAERHRDEHWPEDLDLRQLARGTYSRHQRRWI